jgi:hypothetical protein
MDCSHSAEANLRWDAWEGKIATARPVCEIGVKARGGDSRPLSQIGGTLDGGFPPLTGGGPGSYRVKDSKMKRKLNHRDFKQTLDLLRTHGFDVKPYSGTEGSVLVTKHGAGAVLTAAAKSKDPDAASAAFAVPPGVMVKSEVGRLLDRGYQKFIKSSQYELPASAHQLQAIHAFSEELKQLTGATSLYNQSLGTTSDVYQYDRLLGREAAEPEPVQPWESTDGH